MESQLIELKEYWAIIIWLMSGFSVYMSGVIYAITALDETYDGKRRFR